MNTMSKPTLLSGIQPSGDLMIGNYIGAISNWVELQNRYDCLFVIVDLHAITVMQDPAIIRRRSMDFLCLYLACGIDPSKSTIFVQSHVPGHSELTWILDCYTTMGELGRMTQFKEKSRRHRSNINVGLFNYPVLMASDILLYRTDLVPVGDDQKQHIEICRDIATRFNHRHGDVLTLPEPYIPERGARIMSLADPGSKMSKSDENQNSFIGLLDPPDTIRKKLKQAVTDSGSGIRYDPAKPGIANLLTIYSELGGGSISSIEQDFKGKGYGVFKNDLAEAIIEFLRPIQERHRALSEEEAYLTSILGRGAEAARLRSEVVLRKVHDVLGFVPNPERVATKARRHEE